MPNSVRCIIKKCLYKGAINQQEFDKIMRKLDEPIRCKNCKHFSRTLFLGSGYNCGECHRDTAMRPGVGVVMKPDDYCSKAERREEE